MCRTHAMLVFLLLLSLGGCSSTTFIYNRLDFILPWYLDDYVELDREQDTFLDRKLAPFLAWHRSEELPRYLLLLENIDAVLDREMTADDVAAISLEIEQAWFRLEGRALNWLLALGVELTDAQVDEFMAELWARQKKYEEKYLDRLDHEYREDSYDSLVDNVQDYLGRLDDNQKRVFAAASGDLLRSDAIWLRERTAWLHRVEVFMQREPGWQQRIRGAAIRRSDTASAEYLRVYEHNLSIIHAALAEVLNSRTARQDRRLRKKLDDLSTDLQTLISQRKQVAALAA